ncbi:YeeE/YedE family protein [Aurantiacibacter arachoides]|uniref:YeeE/YedE family protein n=1 Tax=Aurantiacibacter arachoides TaxID=1850444 RepID=UPI0018F8CEB2|nr:YeeE/YedE family protein [Aurantiacibacter arachoides]GGD46161.1 membrane protein [Aurantiacibacter arachoides]
MALVRKLLPPLASGFLFGMGLTISGMTDPGRVRGFLDIFGDWDPTLAFVMGGAVVVMAIAWRVQARMVKPVFGERFSLPDRTDLDPRLLAGAAVFGVGWGVAGLCPGPAVASLALSPVYAAPFVAAMLVGMLLQKLTMERKVSNP